MRRSSVRLRALASLLTSLVLGSCLPLPRAKAPSQELQHWGYPTLTVVVQSHAPECVWVALEEAWKLLKPKTHLQVRLGVEDASEGPLDGVVTLWLKEAPDPRAEGMTLSWRRGGVIRSAAVWVEQCDVRLFAHELGHALGLPDRHAPGSVMHGSFDEAGWDISPAERAHLGRE